MNWLKTFALAAFAVTAPVHTVMLVTGILIFVDLGVGIWRAIKVDEPITSYRLRNTITKLFAYNIVILSSWMIETYILEGFLAIPAMKIVATFIALTELKSIL